MPPNPPMFALHCSALRSSGQACAVQGVGMVCPIPFAQSASASPALATARKVCRLEAPFPHSEEPL